MSVLILRPNADTETIRQIPSTGETHYNLIDEETKDEADYLKTDDINGRTDIYGFPNHSSETESINSVTVKCYAKYILTGTTSNTVSIDPLVSIGGTTYLSGAQTVSNSVTLYSYTWSLNPNTSEAWTWTQIDALLAGDKIIGGYVDKNNTKFVYCYQLWVEVAYGEAAAGTLPLKNVFNRPFRGVFR